MPKTLQSQYNIQTSTCFSLSLATRTPSARACALCLKLAGRRLALVVALRVMFSSASGLELVVVPLFRKDK